MSDEQRTPPAGPPAGEEPRGEGRAGHPGQPEGEHPSGAVARARADLAAGRAWKARDRLLGHVHEYDPEALDLLGEVLYSMGDLPAAGAVWFGTSRRGPQADEAIDAWRERHADHFPQMWRSLPRSVREREGSARVEALRRRAELEQPGVTTGHRLGGRRPDGGGPDAAVVIAVVLAVLFVGCAVVGLVTVLRWLIPG